ncbi:MAG: PilN domain-containing protein [Dissulfurispiraceae bacterium]
MIRINLLIERKERRKAKAPVNFLVYVAAIIFLSLLVMGGIVYSLERTISGLKDQIRTNKTTLADLQIKSDEIRKYEQLIKELEQKAKVIETLRVNQSIPVKVMDDVSTMLPEGIWLSALTYKDASITLEGYAFSNLDIVAYVENLKKTVSLVDVNLNESKEVEFEKVPVYKFNLSFKVNPNVANK